MNLFKITFALAGAVAAFGVAAHAQYVNQQVAVAIQNNDLIINGYGVGGCIQSATPAYQFAGDRNADTYVFAVGCDNFPYTYSFNRRSLSRITDRTRIRLIRGVTVGQDGYVQLVVTGTGGSRYSIGAGIYAPSIQPAPVFPAPGPVYGSPVGHGYTGCNVLSGGNAYGGRYWNVLARSGAIVAQQVRDYGQAQRIAATDPRCQ